MKSVAEIRQETAEVLGSTVAEVAKRAIQPELEPFKQSLENLVGSLRDHAEELEEQVRDEKKALNAFNKQLGEVISVGKDQAAAAAATQTQIQDLRERLDALESKLARTCEEHTTTVAALNALRGEVLGWMRTSHEQATRLTTVLERAESLTKALDNQTDAFTEFRSTLLGRVDSYTDKVSEAIEKLDVAKMSITDAVTSARDTSVATVDALDVAQQKRQDAAMTELKVLVDMVRVKLPSYIKAELKHTVTEQIKSVHSEAQNVIGKIDAAEKSIAFAVESARRMGANELDALGDKQQSHHDKAVAELKVLLEVLRPDLVMKIETGLQQTVNRLEPGNQRALDQIGSLRSSVEMQGAAILTEFGVVLGKLNARHEDHGRELVKTGQMAGRVFRLAVANLFLVLVALALGGFALWQTAK